MLVVKSGMVVESCGDDTTVKPTPSGKLKSYDAMTNGIALSPDESFLYLSEVRRGTPSIIHYDDLDDDDNVSISIDITYFSFTTLIEKIKKTAKKWNIYIDGIATDENNNLYVTLTDKRASVAVIQPSSSGDVGNLVEIIRTGMLSPTNLAFYKKTLFVVGAERHSKPPGYIDTYDREHNGRKWKGGTWYKQ